MLSYSDLLLSIAIANFKDLDARKEVHGLVDELNSIGEGFNLSKDFVLKAGLMLTDIASVGFQVKNFTHSNMAILEKNWTKIRDSLTATVELATSFGFNSTNIRATSALLPIAYYLYQNPKGSGFAARDRYATDREAFAVPRSVDYRELAPSNSSGRENCLKEIQDIDTDHRSRACKYRLSRRDARDCRMQPV